jgi:hypothetical protein
MKTLTLKRKNIPEKFTKVWNKDQSKKEQWLCIHEDQMIDAYVDVFPKEMSALEKGIKTLNCFPCQQQNTVSLYRIRLFKLTSRYYQEHCITKLGSI